MTDEILHKLKKVLRILFLVVIGLILFFIAAAFYFFAAPDDGMRQKTFTSQALNDSTAGGFEAGVPNSVNVALPDMVSIGDAALSEAPTPTTSVQERKLIQNGALSLAVNRVEDAITDLANIAEKLGGRVDSVGLYNSGDATKKRATVVMRIPAVNFGAGMEQVKGIARKVQSENISTEDVTEKFIDMLARLRNLKAEETQYLDIMKKAVKIEDVLKVSERLYGVRRQIEQLQGQMNYLSRQVDMSVITVELSSEPDIDAANVIWSPTTTIKEAAQGLLAGVYGFLKVIIFLVLFLLPLLILWGVVIVFALWLVWKLVLNIKKRIRNP